MHIFVAVNLVFIFSYPTDNNTFDIDTQFMWGKDLLISPVLEQVALLIMKKSPYFISKCL